MINNYTILCSMLETTRMGQTGLRAVLKKELSLELQDALQRQLREYDLIEGEIRQLAENRDWKLKDRKRPLRAMIEHMTWVKLRKKDRDTIVADMLIQGNTQGMVKTLRDIHRYEGSDTQVTDLSQKLLYCEIENIREMKPFL